ncbi:MAG: restriction endonuclease subunit S [Chlorobium sp.]|nr:restriction endonuclease subunit S [Chlorobium sp.]
MKRVPLGKVCNISMGQAPDGSSYNDVGNGLPLIAGAGDFGQSTPSPKKFTSQPSKISKPDDIIMCIRATIGDLNWSDKPYCLGRGVAGLRPSFEELDRFYLWHVINANKEKLSALGTGSTFKQISRVDIETFEIPLPPLDEQRRIAAILDKADVIRRKRQESIRLTGKFLRSTFLEMFGDPVTNQKQWDVVPIKELGNVTTGNTPSRECTEYYGEGIEWIKSDNINTPSHFLTEAKEHLTPVGQKVGRMVPENSTLVTCIAGSPECIGNAALTNRPVAFNQQINSVTPFSGTDPYFLYVHILVAKKLIQGQSTESMKGMVSKGKFENIPFLKPPASLQAEFGKIFIHFHGMIQKTDSSNQKSTNLFNSLVQLAFRGEL